jgi:hypothetical protein
LISDHPIISTNQSYPLPDENDSSFAPARKKS